MDLSALVLDVNTAKQIGKCKLTQSSSRTLTWTELKALYEKKDNVKRMFGSELLEIDCDIFPLNCDATWKLLEGRVNTHVMLTEDEWMGGKVETGISLLNLEKLFTNDGVPIATLNMYGMKNDTFKGHISKAILKSNAYFGGGRYMLKLWICGGASQEHMLWLKEI